MFNQFGHCMICRDKNKFRMKVDDAKRITYRLELIVSKYKNFNIEVEERDCSKLQGYLPNFRTMCGHCPNINTIELINIERKLIKVVVKIKNLLENKDISEEDRTRLKHESNDFLRGFYPSLSQYILR